MSEIRGICVTAIRKMEEECGRLPWEDRRVYADWLSQTYFYVQHATRVLAKAAYRCHLDEEPLHKKLLHGINEEKNHEILATNDLKHIGHKLNEFYEYPETSAYYQTLYHLIDYNGPYELLGYFVTLEGLGGIGTGGLYERIVKAHGEKAASFVKVHAKLDAGHYEEMVQYLETLDAQKLAIVKHGIEISTTLYCNMLKRITAEAAKAGRSSHAFANAV
jgi:hypothetical protein